MGLPVIKHCNKCNRDLLYDNFQRRTHTPHGKQPWCRDCHTAYAIAYRKRNPQQVAKAKATQRESIRRQRRKIFALLGEKCAKCGFSDWRALHIDHKNGGGNEEYRKLGPYGVRRRVLKTPADYQLLCANCNSIKMFENRETRWYPEEYR